MGQHHVNLYNLQIRDSFIIARGDEYQQNPGNGKFWLELAGMLKNGCKKRLQKTVGIRNGS
jgi:hypothetical protein